MLSLLVLLVESVDPLMKMSGLALQRDPSTIADLSNQQLVVPLLRPWPRLARLPKDMARTVSGFLHLPVLLALLTIVWLSAMHAVAVVEQVWDCCSIVDWKPFNLPVQECPAEFKGR